ncbi:MAG: endonuclease III [Ignavibacteria bacterium]|nr:endonuclease III [Ignavibacteria bacterium]
MSETLADKKLRTLKIINILSEEYPDAKCHLEYKNPFQLLISTILAAQCTDERVNKVMTPLYKKYKSPADFAEADPETLEKELSSINFYRNKTKAVISCCRSLTEKFAGEVPETMEELTSLSGVGRKTANVVLGNCFGLPAIMTDTHLNRVTQRLGLTENSTPEKIETDLTKIVPENLQVKFSHIIGEHGRKICKARKPLCSECVISSLCPSKNMF